MTSTVGTRPRLLFIDGVRGAAALVVLAYHALSLLPSVPFAASVHSPGSLLDAPWQAYLTWPARFGNEMVFVFLFVSAFSLSWTEDGRRARGVTTPLSTFARRRVTRIAPVYYAAFVLGLAVVLLLPGDAARASPALAEGWDLSWGGVLAHLVGVHNLSADWYKQVNPPLWSMAWEVQLYVLFPALYALLRRRPGLLWPTAVSALACGLTVVVAGASGLPGALLPCWFVLGAYLGQVWRSLPVAPGAWLAAGGALAVLAVLDLPALHEGVAHTAVWGAMASCLLVHALQAAGTRRNPLSTPVMRWAGARSYALYATHVPVLAVVFVAASAAGLGAAGTAAVVVLVGVPLAVAVGSLTWSRLDARAVSWSHR